MISQPISLDRVELVAISSIQFLPTLRAIEKSMTQAHFSDVKFFTHARNVSLPKEIKHISINRLHSSEQYSYFILKKLADFIEADFALIVQWDGYVLDGTAWSDGFLAYDYVGSRWPHFADSHVVGNGGFSLRSRRLLTACQSPKITLSGAEDLTICRTHRQLLEEEFGVRFAPPSIADAFAFERVTPARQTFGFHGIFNMIDVEGVAEFAHIYDQVDWEMIGDREIRDCLMRLLRKAPLHDPMLAIRLLRDWISARNIKKHAPPWLRLRGR